MKTFRQLKENLEIFAEERLIKQAIAEEVADNMFQAMVEIIDENDAWDLVEAKLDEFDEASIKGSGTDRKAMLKKAYRRGEKKTRDFYQGKISSAPKSYDAGQKAAFKGGTNSNQGSPAASGKDRSKSQDTLKGTEHSKDRSMPAISTHRAKKYAMLRSRK